MSQEHVSRYAHSHSFGLDKKNEGEGRTRLVIGITAAMMGIEIAAGYIFGSMALLADGIHMASHTVALGIAAFAYFYARKHADDPKFSFGTGKVNALGGYTGAILLGVFAFIMAYESVERIFNPVSIAYNQAIIVAIVGLLVNGISALILGEHGHHHDHGAHDHHHEHDHVHHHHDEHEGHDHEHHHQDHNRRAAYFHVLADALTSFTAIFALLIGKYFAVPWIDPVMGIAGSLLVARWSFGLIRQTTGVLLDHQDERLSEAIRSHFAALGDVELYDVHVWSIAPGKSAAALGIAAGEHCDFDAIQHQLSHIPELVHVTVETR